MKSVLSYCGKTYKTLQNGKPVDIIGWQDITPVTFPNVGKRYVSNCDIPDLELFPKLYPSLKTINFKAGLELDLFQFSLLGMSYMTQLGLVKNWSNFASTLKTMSEWFINMGSTRGAMQMILVGLDKKTGQEKKIVWNMVASEVSPRIFL